MGATAVGALEGLAGLINKRAEDAHQREQDAKTEERQNNAKLLLNSITSGNLSPEEQAWAQEELKKLYPKDTHGMLDQFGNVIGKIFHAKKVADAATQAQTQAPTQGQPAPVTPGSAAPSTTTATTTTNSSSAAPVSSPTWGSVMAHGYPSATTRGTQAGQEAVAQDEVTRARRQKLADDLVAKGEKEGWMTPEIKAEIQSQAGGFQLRPPVRLSAITVEDPDHPGQRISANRNPFTGEVFKVDGTPITDPKIISATLGKPRKGWAKDAQGKFYSFNVDPITNQPMPGTEDYNELPPSGYLDHTRSGFYYYTDDSGNVHQVPYSTQSGIKTGSGTGAGTGKGTGASAVPTGQDTSAVPPGMKSPAAKSSSKSSSSAPRGTPANPVQSSAHDVVGTKDTGILAPAGQNVIIKTQPVLDQVDRLLGDIDRLKLGGNNTPGYLFTARAKYAIGMASPEGTLASDIAGLSLGSVVEAASALQGSSRSIVALKKALVHTPNPWRDSPQLLKEKLTTIRERLNDIVTDAKIYGRKRSPANVPPSLKGPKDSTGMSTSPQNFDDVLDQVFGTKPATSNAPAQ